MLLRSIHEWKMRKKWKSEDSTIYVKIKLENLPFLRQKDRENDKGIEKTIVIFFSNQI